MIRYMIHDGNLYLTPHYANIREIQHMLLDAGKNAREEMKKQGKRHGIFAVKKYKPDGTIDEVDFYFPAVVLDDDEFDERTDAAVKQYKGCLIYAVHELG